MASDLKSHHLPYMLQFIGTSQDFVSVFVCHIGIAHRQDGPWLETCLSATPLNGKHWWWRNTLSRMIRARPVLFDTIHSSHKALFCWAYCFSYNLLTLIKVWVAMIRTLHNEKDSSSQAYRLSMICKRSCLASWLWPGTPPSVERTSAISDCCWYRGESAKKWHATEQWTKQTMIMCDFHTAMPLRASPLPLASFNFTDWDLWTCYCVHGDGFYASWPDAYTYSCAHWSLSVWCNATFFESLRANVLVRLMKSTKQFHIFAHTHIINDCWSE